MFFQFLLLPLAVSPPLTSPEHVLSLQQLDDGGLSGRNQDDAAVFSSTHQATLRRDVHAGRHLREQNTHSQEPNKTKTIMAVIQLAKL